MEDPLKILLIENDVAVVPLIAEELKRKFGCCAYLECTSKLSIAWKSLAGDEFDVILVDLSIANGSGHTLIPTIRSFAPGTPLFALLDEGGELQGMQALRNGVNGCLFKHELHNRTWLERVCRSIGRRRAVLRPARN